MNYERVDGGFRTEAEFNSWAAALELARWVNDSSEHALLQLVLVDG